MFGFRILFASLAIGSVALAEEDKGQIWAVLVAGSSGYSNYRHQSDVCHAYQILHRHGVPDSNIIVMMYDDIANNPSNPRPKAIYNKPNGPNVYAGVTKDYTEEKVTPKNFINVLTGNKKGSGKVLNSGPNDHVFIYFTDHGGPGVIAFPDDILHAPDLIKALKTMHKKKMYKKLVFYLESCESGSMFAKILPKDINIFATTAATPNESSYACYWDDTIQAYLGDEYSVSWMEDIDSEERHENMTTETLIRQFKNVVKNVHESHPQMYGSENIEKDHVVDFLGASKKIGSYPGEDTVLLRPVQDAVSARDVPIETLKHQTRLSKTVRSKKMLTLEMARQIKGREEVDDLFDRILTRLTPTHQEKKELVSTHPDFTMEIADCYETIVDRFSTQCINIPKNTYTLAHLYKLAGVCARRTATADQVLKVYAELCEDGHRQMRGIE